MDNLTIVLPVKGRESFTPRFLKQAEGFEVIQAPGGETLADYWAKVVKALEQVTTPYAMIGDNDDFPIRSGILACIAFLEANPGFVGCSGHIKGIWVWPDKLTGPYCKFTDQYASFDTPMSYAGNDVNLRVLAGFMNSWSFYAIYRTHVLLKIWQVVLALDLKDLMVHEKCCAMSALVQGKMHCFPGITHYVRQYGTSTRDTNIERDWTLRVQKNEWGRDVTKVLSVMEAEGVDKQALKSVWAHWYGNHLRYHFGYKGIMRRAAKRRLPKLAYLYQHRHELNPRPMRFGAIVHTSRSFQTFGSMLRGKRENLSFALFGFLGFRLRRLLKRKMTRDQYTP